ncbi:MAG: sensor histidine kinase [Gemmatimonadales bacterium]
MAIAHEDLLRAAVEAAELGVWYRQNADDRMQWGGPAAELLGLDERVTDLRQIVPSIHPDDRQRFLDTVDGASLTGQPFSLQVRMVRPDEDVRWLAVWGRHIRDPAGGNVRSVGIFRDVTEQHLRERQLANGHRVEAIGHLAAGIAHEINTPTQYVGDNLQFLEESFRHLIKILAEQTALLESADIGPADRAHLDRLTTETDLPFLMSEVPRAAQQARDGIRRIGETVSAVKAFAHPGSGQREPTDLNEIVEATLAISRNEWKYVATAETQLDPQLPLASCLRSDIQQAVLNLVINAAHTITDKVKTREDPVGRITIRTRTVGSDIELSVADTGEGIPEAIRPRVFDLFFTTKDVGKGTGQGLALVYDVVVKKHGGSVWFDSSVGRGTTFYLRLPRADELPEVV